MMKHILYKTTNIKTGRFYVGVHSTENLDDGYLGSGVKLKKSIQYHGRDLHKREILEFFETRDSAYLREAEIVNEDFLKDPLCMNISLGGVGGEHTSGVSGGLVMAKRIKNDPKFKEKYQKLGSDTFSKLHKEGKIIIPDWTGKKHTEDSKEKIRSSSIGKHKGSKNSQYGKVWIYNLDLKENKKITIDELESYLSNNWIRGRKMKF